MFASRARGSLLSHRYVAISLQGLGGLIGS